jgi:hypothetical protein
MSYIVLLFYCFQILSVKLNELESLRNYLHEKEKSVVLSTLNTKKVTASMIHAEPAFASAKMQGMLKQHKEAMEREHNVNKTINRVNMQPLAYRRVCMLCLLLGWASQAPYALITLLQRDGHVLITILVVVMSDW